MDGSDNDRFDTPVRAKSPLAAPNLPFFRIAFRFPRNRMARHVLTLPNCITNRGSKTSAKALHRPGEGPGAFLRHRQMQAFADVEGITILSNKLPSNSS